MRSAILLIFAFAFTLGGYANFRSASLSVSAAGNQNLLVVIGNSPFSSGRGEVSITNLAPGIHSVKVYRQRHGGNRGRMGSTSQADLLYASSVALRPMSHIDIRIDRFGQVNVRERTNARRGMPGNHHFGRDGRYPEYGYYREPINARDFHAMLFHLGQERIEMRRVELARQIFNDNYFTSEQVRSLLSHFSFDQHKLDLAKYAYGRTIDVNNYYIVSHVLSFESNKRSLENYIRRFR